MYRSQKKTIESHEDKNGPAENCCRCYNGAAEIYPWMWRYISPLGEYNKAEPDGGRSYEADCPIEHAFVPGVAKKTKPEQKFCTVLGLHVVSGHGHTEMKALGGRLL